MRKQLAVFVPDFIKLRYNTPEQDLRETVTLDVELIPEIYNLWELGIETTGHCSGHGNKELAYIGVVDDDIQQMKDLGYEVAPNPSDLTREDSFKPKSV